MRPASRWSAGSISPAAAVGLRSSATRRRTRCMPSIELEGRSIAAQSGDSIASALYRAGVRTFSRSFKYHRPRGLYCLTGDCPNCLVTVDGEPAVRACCTEARNGQRISRDVGWPSTERDVFSVFWYLRRLLPVGFYYKTFHHPRALWPIMDRVIRRLAGLGPVPRDLPPAHRESKHHHPDLFVAGGGVAGLPAAPSPAEAGRAGRAPPRAPARAGRAPAATRGPPRPRPCGPAGRR